MNSLYQLGPGLTSQLGPFKTHKGDYPKVRKTPWKGGGVAGGGQLHAGNGNWYSCMTPTVIRATPYPLEPSQYASLVGPAKPSTYFTKSNMGRQAGDRKLSGRVSLNPGVQAPGQGNQNGRQLSNQSAQQNQGGEQEMDESEESFSDAKQFQGDGEEEPKKEENYIIPKPEMLAQPQEPGPGTHHTNPIYTPSHVVFAQNHNGTQIDPTTSKHNSKEFEQQLDNFYVDLIDENFHLQTIIANEGSSPRMQSLMRGIMTRFGFNLPEGDINISEFENTMKNLGMTQDQLLKDRNALMSRLHAYTPRDVAVAETQTVAPHASHQSLHDQYAELAGNTSLRRNVYRQEIGGGGLSDETQSIFERHISNYGPTQRNRGFTTHNRRKTPLPLSALAANAAFKSGRAAPQGHHGPGTRYV